MSDPSLMKLSLRIAWRLGDITHGMSGVQSASICKILATQSHLISFFVSQYQNVFIPNASLFT